MYVSLVAMLLTCDAEVSAGVSLPWHTVVVIVYYYK